MHKDKECIIAGHQSHYMPWVGYFSKISVADKFCLLDSIQFNRNWFQSRNAIRTKEGSQWLTVPVRTKGKFDQKIKDVEIDNSSNWRRKHWKSILQSYQKAPYFNDYSLFFEDVYKKDWTMLVDLNQHIIEGILDFLNINKEIVRSSDIGTEGKKTDLLIDICRKSKSSGYLSGSGGAKEYVELEKFKQEGLLHYFLEFEHPKYNQIHGNFLPRMAIIDLLFNCGPEAEKYVKGAGKRAV